MDSVRRKNGLVQRLAYHKRKSSVAKMVTELFVVICNQVTQFTDICRFYSYVILDFTLSKQYTITILEK